MKKRLILLATVFFVTFFFAITNEATAGSYSKEDFSIFLGGEVHVRFDQLLLGWTKTQEHIDRIKYRLTCLNGNAILTNVEYLDRALTPDQTIVRWRQSATPLFWDFSERFNRLDGHHKISIGKTNSVKIKPYCLDSARVRFHIRALARNYLVVWAPRSGNVYTTWVSGN
ncbi:MAG: hypothetical protein PHV05_00575 [Candidatus Riflebacteria bacterium]|nr:hypothetical protein [Candidatus Riflebacteria bacterium]